MWPLVRHQIDNARLLATVDKGRPRSASLRRAVSTAYYAVFQGLCRTCADSLVGWRRPWALVSPVFRAPDHARTMQVLLQGSSSTTPELQRLGSAFRELLAAREWADYSPEPRPNFEDGQRSFTREEALDLIEIAEAALAILDRLDEDTRLRLAVRLVTRTRK